MNFSTNERINLINQYKILAALYPDESEHYEELITILENGYKIFYSQIDEWLHEEMEEHQGVFVLNILDLYRAIEDVKRRTKSKEILENHYSFFRGFDGNNETKYMVFARFLIHKQGKFSEQNSYLGDNDNMNSHAPMVWKYRRMLEKWQEFDNEWELRTGQVIEILEA